MTATIAFIQARMSSSRFPGKVLEPLQGEPMIAFMAKRVAKARTLDQVAVITSLDRSDDAIVSVCTEARLPVFRGSLDDVLLRYAEAAAAFDAETIVRLTGDCPLADPAVIDMVVSAHLDAAADYSSNVDPPTFPDGMDVECFTRAVLDRASREATLSPQREHVTLWMRAPEVALKRVNVRAIADLTHVRLTVDYPDDLEAVRRIVQAASGLEFDLFDILRVLTNEPEIGRTNRHDRNEGLAKSLAVEATLRGAMP